MRAHRQLKDGSPDLIKIMIVCDDPHSLGSWRRACADDLPRTFLLADAETARAERLKVRMVAERRNLNACSLGGFKDGCAFRHLMIYPLYIKMNLFLA